MNVHRVCALVLVALSFIYPLHAKKIRFMAEGGISLTNELSSQATGIAGGGLCLAYPVSSRKKVMNVELAIVNRYTVFPAPDTSLHLFRLGFGIRVFVNAFSHVRPYFTHDITTHLLWVEERAGYASGHGVVLGLGVDIPLVNDDEAEEYSSVFFDVSYNTSAFASFVTGEDEMKYVSLSFGFSWNLPSVH